jgi:hypothetical protein
MYVWLEKKAKQMNLWSECKTDRFHINANLIYVAGCNTRVTNGVAVDTNGVE